MSQDPAVFVGTVDANGTIRLDFPAQQRAYCKAKLAGQCVDVIIAPQGVMKSRLQEKGFHAMLRPWVSEGNRYDDLKQFLLGEIFGTMEVANPITGEIVLVLREPHTSTLSRAKYSELIERTLQIAAEHGFILEAPNEYTRRKEQDAKRRKKQEAA